MRRLIGVTLLLVAACGRGPSSPSAGTASPVPAPMTFADFSGLWTAQYRITACDWERHCVLYTGTERPFNLRLVQSGAHVRGLFVDGGAVADIEGDVSTDGTLMMTGYKPPATPRDGSLRITELRVRLGAAPDLVGQFTYENRTASQYSYLGLGMKATGEIVSASRSSLSSFSSTVEGTYRGRFAVRSCAPLSTHCYPDETDDVVDVILTVTTPDGALSATFQRGGTRIPLRGTFSGRTLDLAGETTTPQSGGDTLNRITNWRASIDEFGRMSGTFHLDDLYPVASPSFGGRAECELVQLVKDGQMP